MSSWTLLVWLSVAVGMGFAGRGIGQLKGRAVLGWWLGFLLGLIGIIIIACIPKTRAAQLADAQRQYQVPTGYGYGYAGYAGNPYAPQQPYMPYPPPGQGPYAPYPPGQGSYAPYPPPDQGPYGQQPPAPGQWEQPPAPGQWPPQQPPTQWEQRPPDPWPGSQQ
jgi:hypothetical protein